MTFARGARVAGSDDDDGPAIDLTALTEAGIVFANNDKRYPNDPDYIGKATVGGRALKVRAYWNTGRDGRRFLKLRFYELRTPPPPEAPPSATP